MNESQIIEELKVKLEKIDKEIDIVQADMNLLYSPQMKPQDAYNMIQKYKEGMKWAIIKERNKRYNNQAQLQKQLHELTKKPEPVKEEDSNDSPKMDMERFQ